LTLKSRSSTRIIILDPSFIRIGGNFLTSLNAEELIIKYSPKIGSGVSGLLCIISGPVFVEFPLVEIELLAEPVEIEVAAEVVAEVAAVVAAEVAAEVALFAGGSGGIAEVEFVAPRACLKLYFFVFL